LNVAGPRFIETVPAAGPRSIKSPENHLLWCQP
jgi:hypothetical protein